MHCCAVDQIEPLILLSNKTDLERLQKLQNKCWRNILKLKNYSPQTEQLKITELLSINQIIFKNTMISTYKIVNKIWPEYIYKEVKLKSANERKNTLRNRNEIRH